ncbi:MAG: hypothetical protein U9R07_11740 [Pseudomonadota bacterium]|nr:hypothetical protein [Pseudomonadota bacterium]
MSYSFSVKAASKLDLIVAGKCELVKVIEQQPVHEHDMAVANEAMEKMIGLVEEPGEGQGLSLNMSGSLYTIDGAPKGATLSIHVNPVRI